MKKTHLILTILLSLFAVTMLAQGGKTAPAASKSTSIGIVIYSNDVETVWNAFRLDNLVKSDKNIKEQTDSFLDSGGTILGCGTCLRSRNMNEPQVCKLSSLSDLYGIVRKNKIVMTF
jgi:uncharacterized protein involved in oxidation of intracellular sulfur